MRLTILVQKNTFLQLKHYMQRIYPTLHSTTCVKIHQRTYVVFETISHFSRHSLSIFFLDETLHTFCKSSLSKWKFSNLPLLALKFTKFLMSFLGGRVSFFSKFASLLSVMRLTLWYFFIYIFIYFGKIDPIKVEMFRLSTARMKINQTPYIFFQTTGQPTFKFCITIQCRDTQFLWNFLSETRALDKKNP